MVSRPADNATSPSVRQRRQAETRAALLAAAFELCAADGLDGPSIDDIAMRAGFTKGAFYANFENKQDLFLAMVDERFAAVLDALDATLAGEDPAAEGPQAANAFVRTVNEAPGGAGLFFQFVAFAARDESFRRRFAERYRTLIEHITDIFARWTRDLPAPPIPLEQIALMTCAMGNGFLLEQQVDPSLDEDLHAMMLTTFFRGVQAMTAGWEPPV